MKAEIKVLKEKAEEGRDLYRKSMITTKEAKEYVNPYFEAVNSKSKEIAKKYGMKPKTISFYGFMR